MTWIAFATLFLVQLGCSVFGAEFNYDLGSDWVLIPADHVEIEFPLDEWILQIKTMDNVRESAFQLNITEQERIKMNDDKEDAMTIHIFSNSEPVANIFWSRKGFEEERGEHDVLTRFCDENFANYNSETVCGGEEVQIWSWNLVRGRSLTLSCGDTVEYEYDLSEQNWCEFIGDKIDRILLNHMQNYWIRGIKKVDPTETPLEEVLPTCDCWTAECSYCEDPKCRVKYDVTGAGSKGITLTSKLTYRFVNTIHLFGSDGVLIGSFHVSKKGIFLTGCVKCQTTQSFPRSTVGGQIYDWNVSFRESTLILIVNGKEISQHKLVGECAEVYADIQEFAFSKVGCKGRFLAEEEMEPGLHFTNRPQCGEECPDLAR